MVSSTGRRLILILLGITLAASVSFGSWRLWSSAEPVAPQIEGTTQAVPTAQTAHAQSTPVVGVPVVNDAKPAAKPVHVPTTLPVVDEVRPKELPKGKKHSKQEDLLTAMAQQLHAKAYNHFINQSGKGMWRMQPLITVMPREWQIPEWTSEEITKEQPPFKGLKDLSLIHRLSLNQFNSSNAPETKAAGKDPEKIEQLWEIKSLELVGLVMHDTAKVYVSPQLPKMKELATTPVRDLDVFESEGLEELMSGKDLYVRSKQGTVRVLGPIRASNACLKCHADIKDGDMLGAFSYTLRPAEYRMGGFPGQFPGGNGQPTLNPRKTD